MRLKAARIAPLRNEELTEEQKEILADRLGSGTVFNIFRTLIRAPKAYKGFMRWGGYILSEHNSLPPRERELVILRTGFNWKSGYEWAQHERIGKQAGLTSEEISAIKMGTDSHIWNDHDRALILATDELTSDGFVTSSTWVKLSFLSDRQKMDLVFTVGQYTQVCMMLNSFGVQLDDDLTLDKDLAK